MVFSSSKKLKECFYCKKQIANLGLHITNMHPSVFEQIDDAPIIKDLNDSINTPPQNNKTDLKILDYRSSNFKEILNEKLDQMLSIKVMQMLEKGASIQEIQTMITPPQPKGINIEELKMYKDLFSNQYQNTQPPLNVNIPNDSIDDSSQWLSLINGALPIIKEMLPRKTEEIKNDEHRHNETRNISDSRTIQQETSRDTTKSDIPSEEPRIIIPTE